MGITWYPHIIPLRTTPFNVLVFIYNVLHGIQPAYLRDFFSATLLACPLWSDILASLHALWNSIFLQHYYPLNKCWIPGFSLRSWGSLRHVPTWIELYWDFTLQISVASLIINSSRARIPVEIYNLRNLNNKYSGLWK